MAGDLRLGHREAHVREEAAGAPLADVALRLGIRLGERGTDDVDAELLGQPGQVSSLHMEDCASVKAIRIHADGGPDVLRYEDAPDPSPGNGEVLVRLRAAALNHIDLWIRKGQPSVPKPFILGSDGAGVLVDTGERVVINPGLRDGAHVLGEHRDGTNADLEATFALSERAIYEAAVKRGVLPPGRQPSASQTRGSWRRHRTRRDG